MVKPSRKYPARPVWRLAADTGLLLDFNGWGPVLRPDDFASPDPALARKARFYADCISQQAAAGKLAGLRDIVPGLTSILLHYDPQITDADQLRQTVSLLLDTPFDARRQAGRQWLIPALYDGPDLAAVATATGFSPEEVIRRHHSALYEVAVMGFLPGLGYMTGLDPALSLPRRPNPRTRVPARSLAIAMGQSVIYPMDSPGGWHLIGRVPFDIFDAAAAEPILFRPGDQLRFRPVAMDEFTRLEEQAAAGEMPARLTRPAPGDNAGIEGDPHG